MAAVFPSLGAPRRFPSGLRNGAFAMSATAEQQGNITVTLPDGSTKDVPAGTTLMQVAQQIGAGLAKAALGGKINGELVDLSTPINSPSQIQIVTWKDE